MKNMHMGGVQTGELGRFSGADTQGPEAFHTYMFLHKRFGSEKPARLVELGCAMSGSHMPHVLQAAGSAIREGILFLPLRTEHSIDSIYEGKRQGDLCQLDKAQAAYKASVELGWLQLDSGQLAPDRQIPIVEAWWGSAFDNVYKDLICGEVTTQTMEELGDRTRRIARYVAKLDAKQEGLARFGVKLLLALGGLEAVDLGLLLPAPVRSSRRYRVKVNTDPKREASVASKVYDVVLFQPDVGTGRYRPIVPIKFTGVKNVHDNPSDIMIIETKTQLKLESASILARLEEVGQSQRPVRALDVLWGAITARLPEYGRTSELLPTIVVPRYSHHIVPDQD